MKNHSWSQKGNVLVIAILVIAAIIGGASWYASSNKEAGQVMVKEVSDTNTGAMMEKTETSKVVDTKMMATTSDAMMIKGGYADYSADKLAFAEKGKVVLFFHAPWCPSCHATNINLNKDLSAIPANVLILKTDYDSMLDLKKKYGVTYQHTFVQVDAQGNLITKWAGTETLPEILAKLK